MSDVNHNRDNILSAMLRYYFVDILGFKPGSSHGDDVIAATLGEMEGLLEVVLQESWQPIETAPRDGTEIIITDGKAVAAGFWEVATRKERWRSDGEGAWYWETDRDNYNAKQAQGITHWQPMPKPPSVKP